MIQASGERSSSCLHVGGLRSPGEAAAQGCEILHLVTQLPVEECKQEPASPTPFLPMPKSAAATQLDTDMDKEQEEVPAWFNCSPTSPADDMQEAACGAPDNDP